MKWLTLIFSVIQGILDKIPSRNAAINDEIDDIKSKLHDMQQTKTKWTVDDTVKYYNLTERLSLLEKRSKNAKL